jgi:Mannosyltransferase (PIG-V)
MITNDTSVGSTNPTPRLWTSPLVDARSQIANVSRSVRLTSALLLELVITVYALALVAISVVGGIDFGIVHSNDAGKPILVLLILIPFRITVGGRSWLIEAGRQASRSRLAALFTKALEHLRVPPSVQDAAFAVLATRVATFSIGFLANVLLVPRSQTRPFEMPFRSQRFAEIFAAWDSGWYFDIARQGYYFNPAGESSIAFFPLYPILMSAVSWPLGGTEKAIWLAGIGVSCAAFVLALVAVHRLTEKLLGSREAARRAVLYLAVFPFSLFFTRVYAESLFLLMSVLAVARAYDGKWWRAGWWGALATLTRPNGILIGVPLIVMALSAPRDWRRVALRLAALLPIPVALAGFCAYTYTLSGDPLAWLSAQVHWGYSLGHPPWEQLLKMIGRITKHGFYDYFFVTPMAPYRLFHGVVALIFLGLTPMVFSRLGVAMGTYVLVSLIVPLSGSVLEGVGRYASVLFPVFMLVGSFESRRLQEGLLIVGTLFLALFVCLFVTGRPIY